MHTFARTNANASVVYSAVSADRNLDNSTWTLGSRVRAGEQESPLDAGYTSAKPGARCSRERERVARRTQTEGMKGWSIGEENAEDGDSTGGLPEVKEEEKEKEREKEREGEKERKREATERRMTPWGNLGATSMYHRTRRK